MRLKASTTLIVLGIVIVATLVFASVRDNGEAPATSTQTTSPQEQLIAIDGSSTVYPITEAVAEDFQKANADVRVTVGISGTGGGFKKFCAGEIDISDASRPIKASEVESCQHAGIEFIELPVAFDGLAVMVHPSNTWVDYLTVAELKKIWEPQAQGKVLRWSDVRPGWPDREMHLFGPGADSGTFDYFTEAIVGEEDSSRGDFTASEDDNVLVQGIANDELALGFFGVAYYEENKDTLKLVPIDDENDSNIAGPVLPDYEAVAAGTYQPLSRPIFIYVSASAASRPEVSSFVQYYFTHASALVREVGYIALPDTVYTAAQEKFAKRTSGSVFARGSQVGVTIEDIVKSN